MTLDWRRLVWMTDDELARLDIAAVQLACAEGLPGAVTEDSTRRCVRPHIPALIRAEFHGPANHLKLTFHDTLPPHYDPAKAHPA